MGKIEGMIYLEDGTIYKGKGFGHKTTNVGELVFNTAMVGYQKILTDPSYEGQIINMAYPLMGNYGVNETDNESGGIHAFGVIARDICMTPSNGRSAMDIDQWLKEQETPGVYGIDTRSITKKIRNSGSMKCVISTEGISIEAARKLCEETSLCGDYMKKAGTKAYKIYEPCSPETQIDDKAPRIAVLDLGVKKSILEELSKKNCRLHIFPYSASAEELLEINPKGILITNGPGNPEEATEAIAQVEKLINGAVAQKTFTPIFGIGLGHQILALAAGGNVYKMKYGHRSCNHGVYDKDTGKSFIVSQNHGYAVKAESILLKGIETTHINLNDGTVEGMKHINKPIFSVQFYPESSPGPNDTGYLFDKFIGLMEGCEL